MTTKESLLTEIYSSREVKECLTYLQPEDLREDILQHCFLELLQKSDEFILDLNSRGKLKSYIVKILYNTAHFSKTSFRKQLGKETPTDILNSINFKEWENEDEEKDWREPSKAFSKSINELEEKEQRTNEEEKEKKVYKVLNSLYWYKKEIFELYVELGTIRQVYELTGIPKSSIHKTIKDVRKEIQAVC